MSEQEPKGTPKVTREELPKILAGAISATVEVLVDESKKVATTAAQGANGAISATLDSTAKVLRAGLRKIDRARKQRKQQQD